jgi:acyl carrier protein
MTLTELTSKISQFIQKEILKSNAEISPDIHLMESGLIDSISLMKLLTFLEGELNVEFDEQDFDIEKFSTIHKISALVSEKLTACDFKN